MSKQWYKSKTLWLNVLMIVVGALDYMSANSGGFSIPPGYIGLADAIFNMILRFMTSQPITGTPAAKQMSKK